MQFLRGNDKHERPISSELKSTLSPVRSKLFRVSCFTVLLNWGGARHDAGCLIPSWYPNILPDCLSFPTVYRLFEKSTKFKTTMLTVKANFTRQISQLKAVWNIFCNQTCLWISSFEFPLVLVWRSDGTSSVKQWCLWTTFERKLQ